MTKISFSLTLSPFKKTQSSKLNLHILVITHSFLSSTFKSKLFHFVHIVLIEKKCIYVPPAKSIFLSWQIQKFFNFFTNKSEFFSIFTHLSESTMSVLPSSQINLNFFLYFHFCQIRQQIFRNHQSFAGITSTLKQKLVLVTKQLQTKHSLANQLHGKLMKNWTGYHYFISEQLTFIVNTINPAKEEL